MTNPMTSTQLHYLLRMRTSSHRIYRPQLTIQPRLIILLIMLTPQQTRNQHPQRLFRQFIGLVVRNIRAKRLDAMIYCPDTGTQPYRIGRCSGQFWIKNYEPRPAEGFLETVLSMRLVVCAACEIRVFARRQGSWDTDYGDDGGFYGDVLFGGFVVAFVDVCSQGVEAVECSHVVCKGLSPLSVFLIIKFSCVEGAGDVRRK